MPQYPRDAAETMRFIANSATCYRVAHSLCMWERSPVAIDGRARAEELRRHWRWRPEEAATEAAAAAAPEGGPGCVELLVGRQYMARAWTLVERNQRARGGRGLRAKDFLSPVTRRGLVRLFQDTERLAAGVGAGVGAGATPAAAWCDHLHALMQTAADLLRALGSGGGSLITRVFATFAPGGLAEPILSDARVPPEWLGLVRALERTCGAGGDVEEALRRLRMGRTRALGDMACDSALAAQADVWDICGVPPEGE